MLRRRVARRAALVRQRTRAKNEIHATLARCLLGRSPFSDLFGKKGRAWLGEQQLGVEEAETVSGCLRQIDFLDVEVAQIDRKLSEWAVSSEDARRLMSIPGVSAGVAAALMAAIGDISRFSARRASSSRTSAWTPRSASPVMSQPVTGGSQSAVTPKHARCWSRLHG